MSSSFEVIGGQKLKGEIVPQGAKNEALQIISAVLLTKEKVTISNIPDIRDVNLLIEIFQLKKREYFCNAIRVRGVAQLASVLAWGASGRPFESVHPDGS